MPLLSSFLNSSAPTGPSVTLCSSSRLSKMYGRSNTSNSRTPSGPELGQRRCEHLHRAELQRLHLLAVLEERAVGIDLDLDAALGAFLGQLLEVLGALALGRVERDDVAELDDDRLLRADDTGRSHHCRGSERDDETKLHGILLETRIEYLLPRVVVGVGHSVVRVPVAKIRPRTELGVNSRGRAAARLDAIGCRAPARPLRPRRQGRRPGPARPRGRRRTIRTAGRHAANGAPRPLATSASPPAAADGASIRMRSPPDRGRIVTGIPESRAAANPLPSVGTKFSVPCGSVIAGSPHQLAAKGATAARCTAMRPRWTPSSRPSWTRRTRASSPACTSWRSMASRRAAEGARSPCWRRNQRNRFCARGGARPRVPRRRLDRARSDRDCPRAARRRHRSPRARPAMPPPPTEAGRRARASPDSRETRPRAEERSRGAGSSVAAPRSSLDSSSIQTSPRAFA